MRFKRVYIEITNTCNLTCAFCIQNHREPKQMRVEEFQHIINEIQPYTKYVYLHILGEPLSHPKLDALLAILDEAQLQVNITTNGTLLKKNLPVLLSHHIRQINVSLHSFPQHIQPYYFEDVFATCEILAQQSIYINYRLWNLRALDNRQQEAMAILKQMEKRYAMPFEVNMQRLQRIPLMDHIALHFEEVFTWPSLANPFVNNRGRCLGMKDMCGILSNGDVVPCCLDSNGDCKLGNIHETAFSSIMESSRVSNIVEGFQQHRVVEELCQHCSYRTRFYEAKKGF